MELQFGFHNTIFNSDISLQVSGTSAIDYLPYRLLTIALSTLQVNSICFNDKSFFFRTGTVGDELWKRSPSKRLYLLIQREMLTFFLVWRMSVNHPKGK